MNLLGRGLPKYLSAVKVSYNPAKPNKFDYSKVKLNNLLISSLNKACSACISAIIGAILSALLSKIFTSFSHFGKKNCPFLIGTGWNPLVKAKVESEGASSTLRLVGRV